MKTKYIIFFVTLFSIQVFSQNQTTNDSVAVNGKKYFFTLLSYGKHSKSKPIKVFTCYKKDFQKVKNNIKKCYIKYKIEYTEFYLIPIDENDDNKILIINHCLKKIDDARMLNNLSTIQVPFKENYDNNIKNIKFNYEKNNLKDFNKIEDFHQNVNAKNICHLIIVRE